jgi:FKBP-type peptidyl-prolyl cis-trans isomerase (trigger factor)
LILSELLRVENITVSDEEVEQRINFLLANNDPDTSQQLATMFRHESGRAILESQLLREKSVERLLAIARGKGDEAPAPAAAAEDAPTEAAPAAEETESTASTTEG